MRNRNSLLAVCVIALMAAPLLAQESSPPAGAPVENQAPWAETAPVNLTGTIAALGDTTLELNVEHVAGASPEITSALEGSTITLTLGAFTEKPAELKPTDRVELSFTEADGVRLVTRIVPAPLPDEAAAAVTTEFYSMAPLDEAAAQPAPSEPVSPAEPATAQPAQPAPNEAVTPPQPAVVQSAPPPAKPVERKASVPQARVDTSTKQATGLPKPAASLPDQIDTSQAAPLAAAGTTAPAGLPGSEASTTSQPPSSSPTADLSLIEPTGPSEPASDSSVEVQAGGASQGLLVIAIGIAAAAVLVVLGLTLRRKETVVNLGLSPTLQRH